MNELLDDLALMILLLLRIPMYDYILVALISKQYDSMRYIYPIVRGKHAVRKTRNAKRGVGGATRPQVLLYMSDTRRCETRPRTAVACVSSERYWLRVGPSEEGEGNLFRQLRRAVARPRVKVGQFRRP